MTKACLLLLSGIFLASVHCEASGSSGGGHVVGNPLMAADVKPDGKDSKAAKDAKACDCAKLKKEQAECVAAAKAKKGADAVSSCSAKAEACDCKKTESK